MVLGCGTVLLCSQPLSSPEPRVQLSQRTQGEQNPQVPGVQSPELCSCLRLGVRGGDGAGAAPGAAPVTVQVCKRHLAVRSGVVRERFLGGFCSLV